MNGLLIQSIIAPITAASLLVELKCWNQKGNLFQEDKEWLEKVKNSRDPQEIDDLHCKVSNYIDLLPPF